MVRACMHFEFAHVLTNVYLHLMLCGIDLYIHAGYNQKAESTSTSRPQDNILYAYSFKYPYIPAGKHVYTYLNT